MRIKRQRWVMMRYNHSEILCGTSPRYYWRPISNIGHADMKTYYTEILARQAAEKRFFKPDFEVEFVPIIETLDFPFEIDEAKDDK